MISRPRRAMFVLSLLGSIAAAACLSGCQPDSGHADTVSQSSPVAAPSTLTSDHAPPPRKPVN